MTDHDLTRLTEAMRIAVTHGMLKAWEMRIAEADPEIDWCAGRTENGERCQRDAVRDGLCKQHWRARNVKPGKSPRMSAPDG